MYSMKVRVRYSEADANGVLKLTSLVDYLQDCCIFHSEDIGYTVEEFAGRKRVWMLISWQIVIHDLPRIGEYIEIITNPYGFERFIGSRNFALKREDGSVCVIANSTWAYMDVEKQRPARVDEEMQERYQTGEPFEMDYAPRKVETPPREAANWRVEENFAVMSHHLDTNYHVNNGQYIRMADAYLPADYPIGQIRVEYKRQAKLGNRIVPYILEGGDGTYLVDLCDEKGDTYAAVEFAPKAAVEKETDDD